jgi:hypothetical protein
MDEPSIYDLDNRWMIRMRLMRRDLDAPDLGDAERERLEEQLEQMIDVPVARRNQVEDLAEDELIRLMARHESEENLPALPEFIERAREDGDPGDPAFVIVLWQVEWNGDGAGERVGTVRVHASDPAIEYRDKPWYDALALAVEQAWARGLDRVYLTKMPARRA